MYSYGRQAHRSMSVLRIHGLLFGLTLLSLGACTPQPEQHSQARVDQQAKATVQTTPATGEVPADLLDNIISDLSTKGNFDKEAISIIRAESVIWPDGSLGCPKPGEMHTQAAVQGYWVVLQSAGKKFDYRASSTGYFFRCTNTFKVRPPVG